MYIRRNTHHAPIVPYLYACLHLQGILDMLVLSQAEGTNDLIIHALKNNFEADAYFVKVMGKCLICPVCSVPLFSPRLNQFITRRKRKAPFCLFLLLPKKSSPNYIQRTEIWIFFLFRLSICVIFTITAPPRPIKTDEHEQLFSHI